MGWRWSARNGCKWTVAAAAVLLAGCSSGLGGLGPASLPYQHSNAMMTAGYAEEQLAPDRYRISVTGYPHTPRERLEKMAATRAAEIGTEMKLGSFKIESVAVSTECKKFKVGGEKGGSGGKKQVQQYVTLTAEVAYAKVPPDASYVSSKEAFPLYRAELDTMTAPPVPPDPLAPQCS